MLVLLLRACLAPSDAAFEVTGDATGHERSLAKLPLCLPVTTNHHVARQRVMPQDFAGLGDLDPAGDRLLSLCFWHFQAFEKL